MRKHLLRGLLLMSLGMGLPALQAGPGAPVPEGEEWGYSGGAFFSVLRGRCLELVMPSKGLDAPYTSKLIWELEPVFLAGVKGSANWKDRVFLNLAAATALNSDTGQMEDYDWLYDEYPEADTESWTNYSRSDISLLSSLLLDLNVTYRAFRREGWSGDLIGGYKLVHWSWTDSLLEIDYPYSSGSYDHLNGKNGIDYRVNFHIPYLGAGISRQGAKLDGSLSVRYSGLVAAKDRDNHKFRNIIFTSYFYKGRYLGLSALARLKFNQKASLALSCDWEEVFETVGDVYVEDNGVSQGYVPDGGGAAYYALSTGLALEYRY